MSQYRKKPVVIEAITFEEFVAFAKATTQEPNWSIPYQGVNVTHENDELYIIPTLEGNHNFTPQDMLITGVQGEIYPCKKDIFEATYDLVIPAKTENLTFEEAEKLAQTGELIALPEWSGFWFVDIKTGALSVLTKDNEILQTPFDEFKTRNDWKTVFASPEQSLLLEKHYQKPTENPVTRFLSFGEAIEALKNGQLISRNGWNGKGMFIVKQIPALIGLDIIPKMQSLPQSAKDKLIASNQPINYTNQMLIVNAEGRADSWVPSSSDVFAEDWIIVE